MTKLVLASSSPYRQSLLRQLMVDFEVIVPNVNETPLPDEPAYKMVERLAVLKAQTVAKSVSNALVIGSDQIAVLNGKMVGKPFDHQHAVEQLSRASAGNTDLYTGVALVNTCTGHIQSDVVPYKVVFKTLTPDQIERYLIKEQPYNCCGSLRVDGLGIALLQSVSGDDPSAIIGLPLIRLVEMLEQENFGLI